MNIIEEAAKRLRQLESAGVELSTSAAQPEVATAAIRHSSGSVPEFRERRTIDLARLQAAGFITPALQDSKLLHEFRLIKRPLIQHAIGRTTAPAPNRNLVMVTSALAREGKTFVALNLAMAIAREVDCGVLLVDADVVSPTLPAILGIEPASGLMDLLTDPSARLADVLIGTNVERLTLLLAGTPQKGASELLASEAMRRLVSEIATGNSDRVVVFDSPPLLPTTESRALASHVGQVVIVVEAERTTHAALESALATVESCPAVYTLLNKAPESKAGLYYGAYAYPG
jgi:exopolysaccharide/PEP-CTERM locus tyrosine autokinase